LKKTDGLTLHQDYYDFQVATAANQTISGTKNYIVHDALTNFADYTKMYDAYEQWNEGPRMFLKNIRINYFLRMQTMNSTTGPIDFTIFIYSPKPSYKKLNTIPQSQLPAPEFWIRKREYFYDSDPNGTAGVVNVMLNPEYFQVHTVKRFRIAPHYSTTDPSQSATSFAVMTNTNPMDTLRTGQIKLKVNKYYKHISHYAGQTDDWTNITNDRVTLSKQIYVTAFHSSASRAYDLTVDPSIDLTFTCRATVKHLHQKSKNVINNEVDAIP